MTRKKIKDQMLDNGELESESFLSRMRNTQISQGTLDLARQKYGYELPEDVIEVIARQQAVARPILEQYHTLHEATPTLTMARATMQKEMDEILDTFCGMDLNDIGDIGEFHDEYSCPKCAHRWSGAPNNRTGYGNVVYVPTGKLSKRSGLPSSIRYGAPAKTAKGEFSKQRYWKAARASQLPRGFGNRPIGEPIIGETWRRGSKPPAGYEDQ